MENNNHSLNTKTDVGKALPRCGCSTLKERIAGEDIVCEMHKDTKTGDWENCKE